MSPIRLFLLKMLGARGHAAIAVGSSINNSTGRQRVVLTASVGLRRRMEMILSPDGARRIASQLVEWADAADERNAKLDGENVNMVWRAVIDEALTAKSAEPTS